LYGFLFGHAKNIVARELADQIGMTALNVSGRSRNQLLVGIASHRFAAFAMDHFAHDSLL